MGRIVSVHTSTGEQSFSTLETPESFIFLQMVYTALMPFYTASCRKTGGHDEVPAFATHTLFISHIIS